MEAKFNNSLVGLGATSIFPITLKAGPPLIKIAFAGDISEVEFELVFLFGGIFLVVGTPLKN